jgi:hypothetical protein
MTTIVLAGTPNSGKSTFVAALSHLLNSGELPTALSLTRLSADEHHLSWLQERWLDAELVDRTKKQTESWVTFHIEEGGTEPHVRGDLLVPDLRGELFIQPATMGVCDRALLGALQASTAILLFTSAETPTDNVTIGEVNEIMATPGLEEPKELKVSQNNFVPDNMPEQVKLVELLQAINRQDRPAPRRRLAIVVSAWDIVQAAAPDATAEQWVQQNRPMLDQFLRSNDDLWDVAVFGVSAQGGVLPRDAEKFKKLAKQSSRIIVSTQGRISHDLTSIIAWAIQERK